MRLSIDLMPQPFAWIDIPAGKVTLTTDKGRPANYIPEGESQTFDVPAFAIAKYPLTNAQFAKFIEADGYSQRRWWTDAGWQFKEKECWTEPRFWPDRRWNKPDYPVVGVSWYEALAFCLWLSEITGERIMLPTEQQWQRAAQGNTHRIYPWGNAFIHSRCNFKPEGTTPVTQYEGKGDSPFGVVDMSGNVWEWCLTAYDSGSNALNGADARVLRGGAWNYNTGYVLRVDFRGRVNPEVRLNGRGFRLARAWPLP